MVSITAEISQTFAKPSQTRTWIANAGEQNFVIEINVWCGIYNYCYMKVFTELSIFEFSCIITCVTWRSLTSKMVDRFNLTWNIPIVNVLQHHLTFYCKRKILQVIYTRASEVYCREDYLFLYHAYNFHSVD